jgi:hypothetical protein
MTVGKTRVYYYYDRYNTYKSQATVWNIASRATSCSFRISIVQVGDFEEELIIVERTHNHDASHNAASHGVHRRQDRTPQLDTILVVVVVAGKGELLRPAEEQNGAILTLILSFRTLY